MRNLLALVALFAIVFLGLGWYLDWYRIERVSSEPGRSSFQIEIDRNKIGADSGRFLQQGSERINEALQERNKAGDTDSRARTDPGAKGAVEEAEPRDAAGKPPR